MFNDVYLLLGPEEGEKNDKIRTIKDELKKNAGEFDEEVYFASEDDKDILLSLHQPSLFSSFRLITVKHLENAKKDGALIKGLKEYLKNKEEDVALLLISTDSISPFSAAEEKYLKKEIFYEIFDSDKILWIREEFKKSGFQVTEDAIEEILSSIENNKADMKNLIDLVCSYYRNQDKNKKVIDSDDVASIITREKGENGYTLFKAVAKRNLEESLLIASTIALNDSTRLLGTLMTLSGEFRVAENIVDLKKKGMDLKTIQKEAKGISLTPFQSKGFNFRRRDALLAAASNYSINEIKKIIVYLTNSEEDLKTAGSDAEETFYDILYNVIINGGENNAKELYTSLEVKLV